MNKQEALAKIKELENYINSLDVTSLKEKVLSLIPMVEFNNCEIPFKMGIYQVTQELWELVTGDNPSYFKYNPQYPVETVSYNDIVGEFLPKLNEITGLNFRLPTEYEWMLCAQVDNTIYSGSDDIDEVVVYNQESPTNTGSLKPNSLGIYDMSGNVWEWCDSSYNTNSKVIRGGSWFNNARYCRVAYRDYYDPTYRGNDLGFRLTLNLT